MKAERGCLYKAVVTVSHGNADGTREIGRDEYSRLFDSLDGAVRFIEDQGKRHSSPWDVASCRLFEYKVSSVRELVRKKRTVAVVMKNETYWGYGGGHES